MRGEEVNQRKHRGRPDVEMRARGADAVVGHALLDS